MIQNIQTDPREAPWREASVARGYASLLSLPLRVDDEVIGAITIAAPEPDAFSENGFALLGETADDLAFAIETLRVRARHRAAEETIRRMAWFDALTGLPTPQPSAPSPSTLTTPCGRSPRSAHGSSRRFTIGCCSIARAPPGCFRFRRCGRCASVSSRTTRISRTT